MNSMKLDLLENGIDFIRSGVETFFSRKKDENDPRKHKYAVLHLFSGVLLILKERLSRAHPALIFERVEDYGSQSEKTVRFDQLVRRLDTCADVQLTPVELDVLRRAQKLRNDVEHYHCTLNLHETQKLIGQLIEVAYMFLRRELDVKVERRLSPATRKRISALRAVAREIEREELERWERRAQKYRKMTDDEVRSVAFGEGLGRHVSKFTCAKCHQVTAVLAERGIVVCQAAECRSVHRQLGCFLCGEQPATHGGLCESCVEEMKEREQEEEGKALRMAGRWRTTERVSQDLKEVRNTSPAE